MSEDTHTCAMLLQGNSHSPYKQQNSCLLIWEVKGADRYYYHHLKDEKMEVLRVQASEHRAWGFSNLTILPSGTFFSEEAKEHVRWKKASAGGPQWRAQFSRPGPPKGLTVQGERPRENQGATSKCKALLLSFVWTHQVRRARRGGTW